MSCVHRHFHPPIPDRVLALPLPHSPLNANEDYERGQLLERLKRRPAHNRYPHGSERADYEEERVGAVELGGETTEEDEHGGVGTDHIEHEAGRGRAEVREECWEEGGGE